MKLGIILPDLGPSQLTYYLVRNANALLLAEPTCDVVAFFENQVPIALPANFACMPVYEAWGYNGMLVATTFRTAQKAQKCPSPRRKLYYVWDVEWLRPRTPAPPSYREWAKVYRDPTLALLARSAEHATLIEQCWNRPVAGVVDNLNLTQLLEVVNAMQ